MKRFSLLLFMAILITICLPANSWAKMSDEDFLELCEKGTPAEIIKAIKDGANVNATGEFGDHPLNIVAWHNPDLEVIKVLLGSGVDVNTAGSSVARAIHGAAYNGNINITRFLLNAGAEVNVTNRWGETPLHNAANSPNIEVLKLLIKAGADVNAVGEYGHSPLHFAVIKNNSNGTLILLDAGSDVNALDEDDKRPIDYADESFKKTEAYKRLKELSVSSAYAKKLVEPKRKIMARDEDSRKLIIKFYDNYNEMLGKLENVLEKGAWQVIDNRLKYFGFSLIAYQGYFKNTEGVMRILQVVFTVLDGDKYVELVKIEHCFDGDKFYRPGIPAWLQYELED